MINLNTTISSLPNQEHIKAVIESTVNDIIKTRGIERSVAHNEINHNNYYDKKGGK